MSRYDVFSHPAVPFEVAAYCRQNRLTVYAQRLRKELVRAEGIDASLAEARQRVEELEQLREEQQTRVKTGAAFVLHVMKDAGQTK
jgi:chaperonin cofactor prefoldin